MLTGVVLYPWPDAVAGTMLFVIHHSGYTNIRIMLMCQTDCISWKVSVTAVEEADVHWSAQLSPPPVPQKMMSGAIPAMPTPRR